MIVSSLKFQKDIEFFNFINFPFHILMASFSPKQKPLDQSYFSIRHISYMRYNKIFWHIPFLFWKTVVGTALGAMCNMYRYYTTFYPLFLWWVLPWALCATHIIITLHFTHLFPGPRWQQRWDRHQTTLFLWWVLPWVSCNTYRYYTTFYPPVSWSEVTAAVRPTPDDPLPVVGTALGAVTSIVITPHFTHLFPGPRWQQPWDRHQTTLFLWWVLPWALCAECISLLHHILPTCFLVRGDSSRETHTRRPSSCGGYCPWRCV